MKAHTEGGGKEKLTFPVQFRKILNDYNASEAAAAKALKFSERKVNALLTGVDTPTIDEVKSIARLYGCSTNWLLGNKI